MPTPPGFNNTLRLIAPATLADLNLELATQNAAAYWCTDIRFVDASTAVLLFVHTDVAAYGYPTTQKLNLVAATQAVLDADKTTEQGLGYWPTGSVVTPDGELYVLYQLLNVGPLP